MKTWEIERIFNDDIRDKRKTGSGSFHKRGKGVKHGFKGALRTPYYYMTNKEKKALNGKVEVSFMYETVIPYDEFILKDIEIQKAMLTRWRELFSNEHIKKEMGVYNKRYYDIVEELKIPKKRNRVFKDTKNKKEVAAMTPSKTPELKLVENPKNENIEIMEKIVEKIVEKNEVNVLGLDLNYNKICDVEEISRILTKLQLMVEGEPTDFDVKISIKQMPKKIETDV
jgi:hypothetical protein